MMILILQAVAVVTVHKRSNRTISENENIGDKHYLKIKFLSKTAEGVLGILDFSSLKKGSDGELEKDLIELLIKLRLDAKKEKNYALSDKIRDELNQLGIIIQDSKDETTYKIKR
jgi:cysteinyl-tRNA synthetase